MRRIRLLKPSCRVVREPQRERTGLCRALAGKGLHALPLVQGAGLDLTLVLLEMGASGGFFVNTRPPDREAASPWGGFPGATFVLRHRRGLMWFSESGCLNFEYFETAGSLLPAALKERT